MKRKQQPWDFLSNVLSCVYNQVICSESLFTLQQWKGSVSYLCISAKADSSSLGHNLTSSVLCLVIVTDCNSFLRRRHSNRSSLSWRFSSSLFATNKSWLVFKFLWFYEKKRRKSWGGGVKENHSVLQYCIFYQCSLMAAFSTWSIGDTLEPRNWKKIQLRMAKRR